MTLGVFDNNIPMGFRDTFVAKLNSEGEKLWTTQFGSDDVFVTRLCASE